MGVSRGGLFQTAVYRIKRADQCRPFYLLFIGDIHKENPLHCAEKYRPLDASSDVTVSMGNLEMEELVLDGNHSQVLLGGSVPVHVGCCHEREQAWESYAVPLLERKISGHSQVFGGIGGGSMGHLFDPAYEDNIVCSGHDGEDCTSQSDTR
jgi:hypothetical protein